MSEAAGQTGSADGVRYDVIGTSTCRVGSVVDPELRVLGVAGLRVADAGVMPTVVSSNTHAATP